MTSKAFISLKSKTMIDNGRKEITTKKQLEKYPIGSLISYLNINNIFRSGGFIIKYKPEYFIYISPDFKTKYRARYTHIQKMWVGSVYKCANDTVSIIASQKTKTKFPVVFKEVPLYYASDSYDAKRFTHTEKYNKIIKWCEYFEQ